MLTAETLQFGDAYHDVVRCTLVEETCQTLFDFVSPLVYRAGHGGDRSSSSCFKTTH